jgi:hypothetical protein
MGKHLQMYGSGTLRTGAPSAHRLDGGQSKEDQAQKVIEGSNSWRNPWQMIWASAPGAIVQPGKLEIILDNPWFGTDEESLAVLWDNETLVSKMTVQEGSTVYVDIPAINGEVLQVWLTDDNAATIRMITDAKEAQEQERKQAEKRKENFSDSLKGAADTVKESTSNLKWSIAGLALLAVGGYVVLKMKG